MKHKCDRELCEDQTVNPTFCSDRCRWLDPVERENKELKRYNLQLKVAAQEALLTLPIEFLRKMDEGFIGHLKGEDPKPSTGILGTNSGDLK